MKAKIKPYIGTWSIIEMEAWGQEYVNMEVPGHFTFRKDGTGHFQCGLVQGEMDCRIETDHGRENCLPGQKLSAARHGGFEELA